MNVAIWLAGALWAAPARAQEAGPTSLGAEIATGLRGSLSAVAVSLIAPRFAPHVDLRLGGTAMSATTWATFTNADTSETVSVHPVIVGGTLYFGGSSDLAKDLLRTGGGFEVLVGHTLTPYDDAFLGSHNRIGPNVTIGLWGTFFAELLATEQVAFFIEGGGGFKTYRGLRDGDNPYAIATSWLGSGGTVVVGTRIYRKQKSRR